MMHRKEPWEWMLLGALALVVAGVLALAAFLVGKETWRIEVGTGIAAPPAQVFDWLTRHEKRLLWEPDLIDIAPLTGVSGEAGSTQLLYLHRDGDRWQVEERWLRVLPGRQLELARNSDAAFVRIAVTLRAVPRGTEVLWRESRHYTDWQERLLAPLDVMERKSRLRAALGRLAHLAGMD